MFVTNKVVTNMFVVVPVSARGDGKARENVPFRTLGGSTQPTGFQPSEPARYLCGV
jgi:hypothetical protein